MESPEDCNKTLPDDLVERIVAMVPFPSIFTARGLSRSWLARFSSIASLDDEEDKLVAISFQKLVREKSIKWGHLFPVSVGKEFSCAYDLASQNWVRLPSLSFLPKAELDFTPYICLNGALLWSLDTKARIKYVANIFTRSWKMVPPPPNVKEIIFCNSMLVSDTLFETYKLIQFFQDGRLEEFDHWSAQVYDSRLEAWGIKKLVEDVPILGSPAYLEGVLYMVTSFDLRSVLTLNVEDGTSEELRLAFDEVIELDSVDLVVCDAKVLMIVNVLSSLEVLRVLRIDLESSQLLEVTRGPPAALYKGSFNTREPVSHGDCIFFGTDESGKASLVYNVHQNEWSIFQFSARQQPQGSESEKKHYTADSFQPGFNPFSSV